MSFLVSELTNHDLQVAYVEKLNSKTFDSPEPLVSQYLKESTNFRATLSLDEGLAYSDKVSDLFTSLTASDLFTFGYPDGSRREEL
jgi:hypothetical protein